MLSVSSSSMNDVHYLLEELLAEVGPTAENSTADELYQLGELLYISLATGPAGHGSTGGQEDEAARVLKKKCRGARGGGGWD
jgi:hypothetical protein